MADKTFPLGDGATAQKFMDMGDGTHAPVVVATGAGGAVRLAGYDDTDDMIKVKSVQKKFRESFAGAVLDANKWASSVGAGGSVAVAAGQLVMASGITAGAVTSITSNETFTVPFRVQFHLVLSQRIANQDFIVEAVSVDPVTLQPNGLHSLGWDFNGVTATTGIYFVQNSGQVALNSAGVTIPTTAAGSIYELEPFADEAWFHGGLLDSTAGRSTSYRRHQQIPDPNALYKLRIRWVNGATAPATSTTATMQFIACQDYAELTAEITAGRGQVVAGQAMGVGVVSMPAITGTVTANEGAVAVASAAYLNSAATTNATVVKATTGTVLALSLTNLGATPAFLKLYNKATAPVVGTDVPVAVIAIPANGDDQIEFGRLGLRFSVGIAYAVTGAAAIADVTAVAASQVLMAMSYS